MTGEAVSSTGATVRPTERRVSTPLRARRSGWRPTCHSEGTAAPATLRRSPRAFVASCATERTTSSAPPGTAPRGVGKGARHGGEASGVGVEEHEEQLHPPDAVGEGVVHLHDEGGPPADQVLDEGELPQRVGGVETGHGGHPRQVEDRLGCVGAQGTPPGVGARTGRSRGRPPTRGGQPTWWLMGDPQDRHQPRGPFQARADEAVPVRRPVEPRHGDNRRPRRGRPRGTRRTCRSRA